MSYTRIATPAGMTRFSRVMTTKYRGECAFCLRPTSPGVDFAANASGKWLAACVECAGSLAAQVVALVRTIEAAADGHDVTDLLAASTVALPAEPRIVAAIDGTATDAEAFEVLTLLIAVRDVIAKGTRPADPLVESLRTIAASATASPRDRTFALSLVDQYDARGSLSERQRAAAQNMVNRGGAEVVNVAPVENGLYVSVDGGTIHKLYTTQNGYQACKVLNVSTAYATHGLERRGTFEYVKGGTRMVAAAVAADKARKLTQEEAAAFGAHYKFCCACGRVLNDDRSILAGYGEDCAANNMWRYPTAAEAAHRHTTV